LIKIKEHLFRGEDIYTTRKDIHKMISSISPLLSKFVSTQGHTNPLKKALKYKFNAKVHDSHTNLLNFTKDSTPNYIIKK